MKFYTSFEMMGNDVLVRYVEDGIKNSERVPCTPTLYIDSKEPSRHKSLYGGDIKPVEFESPAAAKQFIKDYRSVNGFNIWGFNRFEYPLINDMFPSTDYDINHINVVSIDIETEVENGFPDIETASEKINAITLGYRGHYYCFTTIENEAKEDDSDIFYFGSEEDMLKNFIQRYKMIDPDIITGWNIEGFDMIYIYNRLKVVLGDGAPKKLSPYGIVRTRTVNVMGKDREVVEIVGVSILDYLDLYKKFTYKMQESYKLDNIAWVELGDRKVHYEGSFKDLYTKEPTKFIEYNIKDTRLIDRLNDKLKLIELVLTVAYTAKVKYEDVFMNTRVWDVIICNHLKNKEMYLPTYTEKVYSDGPIEGAFVKDPIRGRYNWVVSLDLTSLYPMLIMQYNISPETMLDSDLFIPLVASDVMNQTDKFKRARARALEEDATLCSNGAMFRKDKVGILPELVGIYFKKRKEAKNEMLRYEQIVQDMKGSDDHEKVKAAEMAANKVSMLNMMQMAFKILLNSLYGGFASPHFRLYNVWMGEGITISGQTVIQTAERTFNTYLSSVLKDKKDRVCAVDTDSCYIDVSDIVSKVNPPKDKIVDFLVKFADEKLQTAVNSGYEEFGKMMNVYANKMDMKRESIGPAIFVQKKRYVMRVYDSEGVRYAQPKTKIMGLEAVRSSTPEWCRNSLKKSYEALFDISQESLYDLVDKTKKEFMLLPLASISMGSSVQNLKSYETGDKKTVPMHTGAALLYNSLLVKYGISDKYQSIQDGDKIKFIKLKKPNPYSRSAVAFLDTLPSEFGMERYLDKEEAFFRNYLDPLTRVAEACNLNTTPSSSIEDFFG